MKMFQQRYGNRLCLSTTLTSILCCLLLVCPRAQTASAPECVSQYKGFVATGAIVQTEQYLAGCDPDAENSGTITDCSCPAGHYVASSGDTCYAAENHVCTPCPDSLPIAELCQDGTFAAQCGWEYAHEAGPWKPWERSGGRCFACSDCVAQGLAIVSPCTAHTDAECGSSWCSGSRDWREGSACRDCVDGVNGVADFLCTATGLSRLTHYVKDCGYGYPGVCVECTACNFKQYEYAECSIQGGHEGNRECRECLDLDTSTCNTGWYRAGCGFGERGTCEQCKTCGADEYDGGLGCRGNTDTNCQPCGQLWCPAGQKRVGCGNGNLGSCVPCTTACTLGETYEKHACGTFTAESEVICDACFTCPPTHYVAEGDECTLDSDTKCTYCGDCPEGQYISSTCTSVLPKQCTDCDPCGPDEYLQNACIEGRNTVCTACSPLDSCPAQTQLVAQCTALEDRTCLGCPANAECGFSDNDNNNAAWDVRCNEGFFWNGGSCAACTTCGVEERVLATCTPTVDTVCISCVGRNESCDGSMLYTCENEGEQAVGLEGCFDLRECLEETEAFVGNGVGRGMAQSLVMGETHVCTLSTGDTVACFGIGNAHGQLGRGEPNAFGFIPRWSYAVALGGGGDVGGDRVESSSVRALASGRHHTCALLFSWQVKCWGYNFHGQLGLGDFEARGDSAGEMGDRLPVVRLGPGLSVLSVAAGGDTTCVVTSDFRVRCWGLNDEGQLGVENGVRTSIGTVFGDMGSNLRAVPLGTDVRARKVAVGGAAVCALVWRRDGGEGVKCWGRGGVLGLGDDVARGRGAGTMGDGLPYVDLGLDAVTTNGRDSGVVLLDLVAIGEASFCVIVAPANEARCWGDNSFGQLMRPDVAVVGDGPGEMGANLPVLDLVDEQRINGGILQLSAGGIGGQACAIVSYARELVCWGRGIGQTRAALRSWGQRWDVVATGAASGSICGVRFTDAQTLWCGGALAPNAATLSAAGTGALPSASIFVLHPVTAAKPPCMVTSRKQAEGAGTTCPAWAQLAGQRQRVATGWTNGCAIVKTGEVKDGNGGHVVCWGYGPNGELGNPEASGLLGEDSRYVLLGHDLRAVEVKGSFYHYCALIEGVLQLKCWGQGDGGALGIRSEGDRGMHAGEMGDALPFVDFGGENGALWVVDYALGYHFGCALLSNSRIKCWGRNNRGQLGIGSSVDHGHLPEHMGDALPYVDLGFGERAIRITCGYEHACALLADGERIKCWGNQYANGQTMQLGSNFFRLGDNIPSKTPVKTGQHIIDIFAFANGVNVLFSEGSWQTWGHNAFAQTGLGAQQNWELNPRTFSIGSSFTNIVGFSGLYLTCAWDAAGVVKCWGANGLGNAGNGETDPQVGSPTSELGDNLVASEFGGAVEFVSSGRTSTCAIMQGSNYVRCVGRIYLNKTVVDDYVDRYTWETNMAVSPSRTVVGSSPRCSGCSPVSTSSVEGNSNNDTMCANACDGCGAFCSGGCSTTERMLSRCVFDADAVTREVFNERDFECVPCPLYAVCNGSTVVTCAPGMVWDDTRDACVRLLAFGNATETLLHRPVAGWSLGDDFGCAITTTGAHGVVCWGRPSVDAFQLGSSLQAAITGGAPVVHVLLGGPDAFAQDVCSGSNWTCAVLVTGQVKCWGANTHGVLGLARGEGVHTAVPADEQLPFVDLGGRDALSISCGPARVCVIVTDGSLVCWGLNAGGVVLGAGTNRSSVGDSVNDMGVNLLPINLGQQGRGGAMRVKQVAQNDVATCALLVSGRVKCWGYGAFLGLGASHGPHGHTPESMGDALPHVDLGTPLSRGIRAIRAVGAEGMSVVYDDGGVRFWGRWEALASGGSVVGDDDGEMGSALSDVWPLWGQNAFVTGQVYSSSWTVCMVSQDKLHVRCSGDIVAAGSQLDSGLWVSVSAFSGPVEHMVLSRQAMCAQVRYGAGAGTRLECVGRMVRINGQVFSVTSVSSPALVVDWVGSLYRDLVAREHCRWCGEDDGGGNSMFLGDDWMVHAQCVPGTVTDTMCSQCDEATFCKNATKLRCFEDMQVGAYNRANDSHAHRMCTGIGHMCVVSDEQDVYCIGGYNHEDTSEFVQLATVGVDILSTWDSFSVDEVPRVNLGTGRKAREVACGYKHTCALMDNYEVLCWGKGFLGARGTGTVENTYDSSDFGDKLQPLALPLKAISITSFEYYACGIFEASTGDKETATYCWGTNENGRLGQGIPEFPSGRDGDANPYSIGWRPDDFIRHPPIDFGSGRYALQVASGRFINCFLLNTNEVVCLGLGGYLGTGNMAGHGQTAESMGDGLVAVNHGVTDAHIVRIRSIFIALTCAIFSHGKAKCWGRRAFPRAAAGSGEVIWLHGVANDFVLGDSASEVGVNMPWLDLGSDFVIADLHGSITHACGLSTSGIVKCFGSNNYGQLGLLHQDPVPAVMGDALGVAQFSGPVKSLLVGNSSTCAVLAHDDTMECFGIVPMPPNGIVEHIAAPGQPSFPRPVSNGRYSCQLCDRAGCSNDEWMHPSCGPLTDLACNVCPLDTTCDGTKAVMCDQTDYMFDVKAMTCIPPTTTSSTTAAATTTQTTATTTTESTTATSSSSSTTTTTTTPTPTTSSSSSSTTTTTTTTAPGTTSAGAPTTTTPVPTTTPSILPFSSTTDSIASNTPLITSTSPLSTQPSSSPPLQNTDAVVTTTGKTSNNDVTTTANVGTGANAGVSSSTSSLPFATEQATSADHVATTEVHVERETTSTLAQVFTTAEDDHETSLSMNTDTQIVMQTSMKAATPVTTTIATIMDTEHSTALEASTRKPTTSPPATVILPVTTPVPKNDFQGFLIRANTTATLRENLGYSSTTAFACGVMRAANEYAGFRFTEDELVSVSTTQIFSPVQNTFQDVDCFSGLESQRRRRLFQNDENNDDVVQQVQVFFDVPIANASQYNTTQAGVLQTLSLAGLAPIAAVAMGYSSPSFAVPPVTVNVPATENETEWDVATILQLSGVGILALVALVWCVQQVRTGSRNKTKGESLDPITSAVKNKLPKNSENTIQEEQDKDDD